MYVPLTCKCIELYRQAVYKENTEGGFDIVNADTSELVTISTIYRSSHN